MTRPRIALIVAVAVIAGAMPPVIRVVLAQSAQVAADERRFEVASVKPGLSPAELGRRSAEASARGDFAIPFMGTRVQPGGRFTAGNVTLKQLVAYAFDVRDFQIEGGPKWLTTDYFEINAVAGFDATPSEMRRLLQALLAERFGFRSHSETRQATVYALTLARSDGRLGARLKPTTPECKEQIEQRKKGTAVPSPPLNARDFSNATPRCGTTMMMSRANGGLTLLMGGLELTSLVSQISSEVAAPVVDQTGLTGLYDITLEYGSERINFNGRAPGLDPNGTDTPPLPLVPALQQQLGLKLDKQIGPMPVVVIDAAELPAPD